MSLMSRIFDTQRYVLVNVLYFLTFLARVTILHVVYAIFTSLAWYCLHDICIIIIIFYYHTRPSYFCIEIDPSLPTLRSVVELGGAHLTMTFGSWIPSYPPMHRGACPALRGRTLPHEDVVLICVGGWSVRYSKVGNYYYSIAVTSLSLNLFTYVISIASAGLGTPASLQHAGKTVKFRAACNVYCIVSYHSAASARHVKTSSSV